MEMAALTQASVVRIEWYLLKIKNILHHRGHRGASRFTEKRLRIMISTSRRLRP